MVPPGQSSSQPLPSKELALFKKIIKCYETKQYKVGLRCAKSILSNTQYADHGETLCMKGLIMNCVGKHSEAMDCVKRGLKADIRSYVCWHVYGLVHRAEKKYDEAIKAYKMALRIDKENMQILRDLSTLQIQMRDWEGYKRSRYELLRLRPQQKMSWVGYVNAYHLLRDYDKALSILDDFLVNNEATSAYDLERSELILYQNMILRESGQTALALQKLEENSTAVVDKLAYQESRGALLMELGRVLEAERVYRQLIERNPDCVKYYALLHKALGTSDDDIPGRLAVLDALSTKHRYASAPGRLALALATGDDLRERLNRWIIDRLRKGIPSLFKNLMPLYSCPDKVAIVEGILLDFVKRLEEHGYRHGCLEDDNSHYESPTTAVWLYALVAQHYDKLRNTTQALVYIDRALQHTPTLIELLMIKAKIYKHAGDEQLAARILDDAQSLDTADRYINSKTAKYLLRAGRIEDAEAMCAKFTRENVKASVSLTDMQCMWFETEMARAHRKGGNYGEALKWCHQVEQHFVGMYEDQFDFHTYCLRKSTLCAYVRLLRLEDSIRGHDFYYNAAKIAIKIYLRILDRPGDIWPEKNAELDGVSASELKKMKRKAAKEKAIKAEAESKKVQKEVPKENGVEAVPVVTLNADDLVKVESPIEEAAKFASPILQLGCPHVTGYTLAFEVYFRKEKPLLMLQCLHEANRLDPSHPLLHMAKTKFLKYYAGCSLSGIVTDIAKEVVERVFTDGTDAAAANEIFRARWKESFPHRMAVAESSIFLDPASLPTVKASILRTFEEKLSGRTLVALEKLKDAVEYGRMGSWTQQERDQLKKQCHGLFRDATSFGGGSLAPPPVADGDANDHHSFD